jgi:mannonate dehydratase
MTIQDHVSWGSFNDDTLRFSRAIGADMICLDIRAMHGVDASMDLRDGRDSRPFFDAARKKVEAYGMTLNSVFMAGWDELAFGLPDRDEKLEAWCRMLRCMGDVGISALGYNFKPMGNFRTASTPPGRGGARYSTFDYGEFSRNRPQPRVPPVDEAEMWENMSYFLKGVIPVAEDAGVRMALHPDDPPIPEPLGGVAQIVSTLDQYRRIFAAAPGDCNGMLFCQGCVTEMGVDVYGTIREMGLRNKIVFVHFRNVRGALPSFQEVFLDEGDVNMLRAMEVYKEVGFNGPFMMDHTPGIPGDGKFRAGHAYAVGYIRALIQAVYG